MLFEQMDTGGRGGDKRKFLVLMRRITAMNTWMIARRDGVKFRYNWFIAHSISQGHSRCWCMAVISYGKRDAIQFLRGVCWIVDCRRHPWRR